MPARPSCADRDRPDRRHPRSPRRLSPGRRERTPSRATGPHRSEGPRTDVADRPHRPFRRVTAAAPRERADRGDGQVRRRPDRELRGRDPRPAGDEPRSSRALSVCDPAASGRTTVPGDPDGHDRRSHPPNACRPRGSCGRSRSCTAAPRCWCRPGRSATSSRCRAWSRSSETVWPTRRRRPLRFLGADRVWPSLGGPLLAASDVVVGVIDTGIWPEHPSFADLGLGRFPLAAGCEFGDGSDPDLGAPFDCGRKLIGAYAFTDTYMSLVGAQPGEFCDNDTGRVLGPQRGRPRHPHGVDRRRGPDQGLGLRPAPRTRERHRSGGATHRVSRVPLPGLLQLGLGERDRTGRPRRRRCHQLLDQRRSRSVLRPRGAGVPRRVRRGDRGERLGGQRRSRARDRRPRRPVGDHRGRVVRTTGVHDQLRLRGSDGATLQLPGSTITRGVAGKTVVSAADVAGYEDPLCSSPMDPGTVTNRVVVCERGNVSRDREIVERQAWRRRRA